MREAYVLTIVCNISITYREHFCLLISQWPLQCMLCFKKFTASACHNFFDICEPFFCDFLADISLRKKAVLGYMMF